MKKLNEMSDIEIKAVIYDQQLEIARANQNIEILQRELVGRSQKQEQPVAKTETTERTEEKK
jgi:hypothetical protein